MTTETIRLKQANLVGLWAELISQLSLPFEHFDFAHWRFCHLDLE